MQRERGQRVDPAKARNLATVGHSRSSVARRRGARRARPCAPSARRRPRRDRRTPARSACSVTAGAPARPGARRPRAAVGVDAAVRQQQLRHAMARAHQVAADLLTHPGQMPDRLDELRRHHHRGQLPGHRQPRQQLGVFSIGLDPIPRRPRRLARRDHRDLDARRRRRAIEPKPGRAGLIDRPHRTRQARQPLHHRVAAPPNRARRSSPVMNRSPPHASNARGRRSPPMSQSHSRPDPPSPGVSRSPLSGQTNPRTRERVRPERDRARLEVRP